MPGPEGLAHPSLPREPLRRGHAEGYGDTFKQLFRRFYKAVRDPSQPNEIPTFAAGLRQLKLVEAVLQSSSQKAWVDT